MNRFAQLLDRLAYEPGRNNKLSNVDTATPAYLMTHRPHGTLVSRWLSTAAQCAQSQERQPHSAHGHADRCHQKGPSDSKSKQHAILCLVHGVDPIAEVGVLVA